MAGVRRGAIGGAARRTLAFRSAGEGRAEPRSGRVFAGQQLRFQDDPDALSCPFGAHIRKVNPRKGPKDVVDVPRVLRRGIPFGPTFEKAPDTNDRGLAFIAFQTSVKSQFEFVSQHWMNSALNPARETPYW